ncbi:MAG: hypothetical protein F6J98_08630 [Moorea sp. SIO4G2]|nr:hypothetical protein [Moorena sp. SIO4A3]NEO60489.1 hypothetical protein [Moorena sp. SIO4G2]
MRYSQFYSPYSLLPTPYSLFPIPYSLFPIPCSLKPRNKVPHRINNCYKCDINLTMS